jgi:dCMP deaminase
MQEAAHWAKMSKCLSRQIGAILVRNKHVIATGYNGPPMGIPHCEYRTSEGQYSNHVILGCPRHRMSFKSGEGMEHCPAVHAEINPIIQCARFGVSTLNSTLYAFCGTPCINCTKEIIQAGITRVVILGKAGSSYSPIKDGDNPGKPGYNFPLAEKLYELANVQLDVISQKEIEGEQND